MLTAPFVHLIYKVKSNKTYSIKTMLQPDSTVLIAVYARAKLPLQMNEQLVVKVLLQSCTLWLYGSIVPFLYSFIVKFCISQLLSFFFVEYVTHMKTKDFLHYTLFGVWFRLLHTRSQYVYIWNQDREK